MNRKTAIRYVFTALIISLSVKSYAQDTVFLVQKPKVVIKSWYPEYKDFPKLKVGETKVLFTKIAVFENTPNWKNDINLITANAQVKIEEWRFKENLYEVTVNPTPAKFIEFDLWFDLGDQVFVLKHNGAWENVKNMYPTAGNRILIDTIKLEVIQ